MTYSTISIEWDNAETIDRNVHRELTELALDHIKVMVLDGFVSGELTETIYDRVSGDDVEFAGTWRIHCSD